MSSRWDIVACLQTHGSRANWHPHRHLLVTDGGFRPLVALVNNGPTKGGAADAFATLAAYPAVDVRQLHRSVNPAVVNVPNARIANLDTTTSAWIKRTATADGAFVITNGRTGESRAYRR